MYQYSRIFTFNDVNTDKIYKLETLLSINEDCIFTLSLNRLLWKTVVSIDYTKNKFRYLHDDGVNWNNIVIPKGKRSVSLNNEIFKQQMKNNNHCNSSANTYYINFETDKSTNRVLLKITNNYKIDFNVSNSINVIFGFLRKIIYS